MRFSLGAHGRVESPAHAAATALLMVLLLTATAGCGAKKTDQSPAASGSQEQSSGNETIVANAPAPGSAGQTEAQAEAQSAIQAAEHLRAAARHQITLTDHRCVRFEPQWTSIHMGQTVTWKSELRRPVRIYVSPGVFDRVSYLVRPGATVTTGPVRSTGRFSFWTEPNACREAPRGVLLAGPGMNVRDEYYASAPGTH